MSYFNPELPIPRLSRRPGAYNSRRNDGVNYYNLNVIPMNVPPPQPSFFMPYVQPPPYMPPDLVQEPPTPSRTVAFNKKNKKTRNSMRSNLIDLSKSMPVKPNTFNTYSASTTLTAVEVEVNPVKEVIEVKSPYKYQHHGDARLKSESSNSPRYHSESRSSSRLDSPRHTKSSREEHEAKFYPKYYDSPRSRHKSSKYENRGDWDAREHPSEKDSHKRHRRRNSSPRQKKEALEDVSDTALEEVDFEEVEVGSLEDSKSEVPVGFRKCKVKYLPCKKGTFFKPKIYYICPERTVINCTNWQEDEWKEQEEEIDVVSEEDYEMETEVVVVEGQTNTADLAEKESPPVVESDKIEIKSTSETPNKKDAAVELSKNEVKDKVDESDVLVSTQRSYRISVTDHQEFYQGEAIIQPDIDAWKSHLIGLGYIIEVRDISDDTNILQHHCLLCSDDIHAENDSGEMVINHVTSYKHMFKYLCFHVTDACRQL